MSTYSIHADGREAICWYDNNYNLIIIDTASKLEIFNSNEFRNPILVDEIILALTSYGVPIPHSFRNVLISDALIDSKDNLTHYYFDATEKEIGRIISRIQPKQEKNNAILPD